jgi:condensin-2 complex subunit D3
VARLASQTLRGLIQHVVEAESDFPDPPSDGPLADSATTPHQQRRRRETSIDATPAPATISPHRRRGVLTCTPKLKSKRPDSTTPGQASNEASSLKDRPDGLPRALVGILQQLATANGLEKATVRAIVVETVQSCVGHLSVRDRQQCGQFFAQLTRSKVPVHRLVGVELVGGLLTEPWLWQDINEESQQRSNTSSGGSLPHTLVEALQGRLVDRTPTVRTASANAWFRVSRQLLDSVSSTTNDNSTRPQQQQQQHHKMLLTSMAEEEADVVVNSLRRRALSDDKASVRRAACTALVELLMVGESCWHTFVDDDDAASPMIDSGWRVEEQDVAMLGTLCQDPSTMTRRSAAEGLTRLLEFVVETRDGQDPMVRSMEQTWISSVLTMVLDSETGCAAKAAELVETVVLAPILSDIDPSTKKSNQSAWRIMTALGSGASHGASRGTHQALRAVLAKNIGSTTTASTTNHSALSIFRTIHRVASQGLDDTTENGLLSDESLGVWCLFDAAIGHTGSKVATCRVLKQSKLDLHIICRAWTWLLDVYTSPTTLDKYKPLIQAAMRNCLSVLSQLAPVIDVTFTEGVFGNLQSLVGTFALPMEIIGPAVVALVAVTAAATNDTTEKFERCSELIRSMYQACDEKIALWASSAFDVHVLARVLFTVGELAMVGFHAGENVGVDKTSVDDVGGTAVLVRGLREPPSRQLVDFVQAFMTNELPGREKATTPESLRAHAFVAFGKLCLRDAGLAKKSLNILARELHGGNLRGNWTVQSNSLLVLGDLCVTHTNMVDRFLPVMAGCLQAGAVDLSVDVLEQNSTPNGSALVRKHAVLLLSSLLLQDYIKWRGLLFHRFLVASVDEDDSVAALAEMVLFGPLLTKQPRLFSNNFVESLFVLNRCTAHPIYQAAAVMGDGGSGISVGFDGINLTGEIGRLRRMRMYVMMLSKLSDEDKIGLTVRIGKEVLGGALQMGSELNAVATASSSAVSSTAATMSEEGAFNVLSDALSILTCPQIRVGKNSRHNDEVDGGGDNDIEDPNVAVNNTKRLQVAKGRLLSNISRKHLIEILLPILCQLKAVLQSSRSPLLKDLMACLLDVYHRYKTEAQECLANDPTTLQEIEYDSQQHKKALRRTIATNATTAGTQTPRPKALRTSAP